MARTIAPAALEGLRRRGETLDLIDVRTPAEYREIHVEFARNVPLDRLDPAGFPQEGDSPLYVICKSGSRSGRACQQLSSAGVNVVSVEGGTDAWAAEGLPVVRGRKAISLERQVRIAAGSLVLAGALLGAFVHPYWIALAAFIGAGLVFSGATNTCGMGLLLARMPWNQVTSRDKAAAPAPDSATAALNERDAGLLP